MNLRVLRGGLLLLLAVFTAACTDESPTDVGDNLLPSGDVRTFEVILDAEDFIAYDTTFTGYTSAHDATFGLVANKFGGVVDSNLLIRMAQPLSVINVRNSAGTVVPDSSPRYFAGRLVIRVDTLRTDSDPPVLLRAFRIAEEWDFSTTWTLRVDTGALQLPWATPGGTRGAQVDTATWAAGDSIVFDLDSATIAEWRDTANDARGALVVSETNNSRMRIASAAFRLQARPSIRPDTIIDFDVAASLTIFIHNPEPPPPGGQLRVGGVTSWRSIIGIKPELRNMTFPCPGVTNCQVRLDQAHINLAELWLQPAAAPPGFIPEDTTQLQMRTLLVDDDVPLQRSPIGLCSPQRESCLSRALGLNLFSNPPSPDHVALIITDYIVPLVSEDVEDEDRPSSTVSLLSAAEPITFGFNAFASGPRLRLVLTAAVERPQ